MAALNLTESAISRLRYAVSGPSRQVLWDSKVSGLGVRVTPANGKQFVLHYRRHGRSRLMSLGRLEDFRNVSDARDLAREHLRTLRRDDKDPLIERRKQKAAGTVRELLDRWLRDHVKVKLKPRTALDYEDHITEILIPEVGALRPADVTKGEARRLHRKLTRERGPVIANRVLATLSSAFGWVLKEDDDTLPSGFANPVSGVAFNSERARRAFLRSDELPAFTRELQAIRDPWVRGYWWLSLLSAPRGCELISLRWDQVDLKRAEIVFPDTKNHEDLTLRLSGAAVDVLRSIPRTSGEYVFPRRRHDRKKPNQKPHMSRPRAALKDALKRAGIDRSIAPHDLRRTAGVLLSSKGFTAEQIARQLGHKSNVTAKVYVLIADELQQKMAESLASATSEFKAPVHELAKFKRARRA